MGRKAAEGQRTEADKQGRTIAETIIVMAHKLGLKVVAEGVETNGTG